ncbi:MAG TPA: PilN domain-containing protein [Candidatus Saccharimonadales bacterium]|nr:PilN domain-containing protein [Candidatus Saccharimonadales bacterium]
MSRIQFNLLPDVKLEYLQTHRTRNFVLAICGAAVVCSVALLIILLGTVEVVQKKQMNDAQHSLDTANSQLKSVSDLNKIVTVQNQLNTLVGLHQNKQITSRLFGYLVQVTPSNVNINKLDLDITKTSLSISGNADSQKSVNTFIDTLKFTTYSVGGSDSPHPAFTGVVESNFSINSSDVSYTVDMQFDPKLFANNLLDAQGHAQTPKLSVPNKITTRSAIDDPSNALFQGPSSSDGGQR